MTQKVKSKRGRKPSKEKTKVLSIAFTEKADAEIQKLMEYYRSQNPFYQLNKSAVIREAVNRLYQSVFNSGT